MCKNFLLYTKYIPKAYVVSCRHVNNPKGTSLLGKRYVN